MCTEFKKKQVWYEWLKNSINLLPPLPFFFTFLRAKNLKSVVMITCWSVRHIYQISIRKRKKVVVFLNTRWQHHLKVCICFNKLMSGHYGLLLFIKKNMILNSIFGVKVPSLLHMTFRIDTQHYFCIFRALYNALNMYKLNNLFWCQISHHHF